MMKKLKFKTPQFLKLPFKRRFTREETGILIHYFINHGISDIDADGNILLNNGLPQKPSWFYITEKMLTKALES